MRSVAVEIQEEGQDSDSLIKVTATELHFRQLAETNIFRVFLGFLPISYVFRRFWVL